MSGLRTLQRVATGSVARRYVATTLLRQSSTGQDGDARKPLDRLSTQAKPKTDFNSVRRQSNQPESASISSVSATNRQRYISQNALETVDLTPLNDMYNDDTYTRSIENYVGTVKIPLGMVNVDVNGMHARGSFAVPLATTEAALVASYSRGCKLINISGGVNTAVLAKTVQRVPEFIFRNLPEAYNFLQWFNRPELFEVLKTSAESTTNHGKLLKAEASLHANKVFIKFVYETGNACGQNISTFATNAAINQILSDAPVQPEIWWLEGGASQDKKASVGLFDNSRGVYVTGEVVCPRDAVEGFLKSSVEGMCALNESSIVAQHMAGCTGLTCHTANALAAIFIACGQDPACVAESHVGITEMRKTAEGDLRLLVTIPSLMIGTVGGGTSLPSQKSCLDIVQLPTENSRDAFAEVIMGVIAGGELSIVAAMSAHHFSSAHHKFARKGNGINNRV